MNILVPIGGRDRHFREEDFAFPKPLIDIAGSPLIEHVVNCLTRMTPNQRFTFVVQEEDCRRFGLDRVLQIISGNARIIRLQAPTQGAVCSCLMAVDHIDPEEELVIANSDQIIRADIGDIISKFRLNQLDAATLTFNSTHPRFSYVRLGNDGLVIEASEKQVISRYAIAGFYYFHRGADFIKSAKKVLMNDNPVQGAYFISQVLNEMILDGNRIGQYRLPPDSYFNLYSPQKVNEYDARLVTERCLDARLEHPPVLLIPMAGEGRRFAEAGYEHPKPFIDVLGKPMIKRVLENLKSKSFRTVAVVREEHLAKNEYRTVMDNLHVETVITKGVTEGSACTALLARAMIEPEKPLLIANCDQIVDFDCSAFLNDCLSRNLDGSILVFRDSTLNPKWSFVRMSADGYADEVKEKVAISDIATVGIYLFTKGKYFIDAAVDMIVNNDRVNNEFYTAPSYNYMIKRGMKVGIYEIPMAAMHGIGVPTDLNAYIGLLQERGDDEPA